MHTTEFDEPVSTAPSVPQALNRYAATSLGQPGVAQAVAGQSLLANIALNAAGNTPSAVVVSFADPTFLYSPIIKGNKTNLLKAVRDAKIASALGDEVVNTINGKLRGKTLKQLGVNYGHVFDYASDNFVSQVDSPTNIKVGTAILGWRKGSPNWRNFIHANGLRIGVGIDVGVSALFEIGAPYWSNPYLSRGQKIGQLSFKVAGFAGASVATYYTLAFITSVATLNPIPLAIATIGAGTFYSLSFSYASDIFIDQFGANQENRRLQPLGGVP